MNNKIKKAVCLLALSAIILNSKNAQATVIKDVKERTQIGSGVEYVKIDRFTENGFIDIDIIKLETKNSFSKLTPLISGNGVSSRATISSMIENSGALAGINGDYFEVTKYPMALGSLSGNGKLILTTPESAFSRNSFFITKDGVGGVGNLKNDIQVTINGKTFSANALNKVSRPYTSLSILDDNWGQNSPGKGIGVNNVELLVANGRVIDKRIGGNPMTIIPGTFVLTQNGKNLADYNIGDTVEINYGSYNNLAFSIGGGNILINNGQVNTSLKNNKSPRTAIGINKDNSVVYLVTVDGRNNSSLGMGELELAEFLKSIGVYQGLNLDGGGSTTMGIKFSGDEKTTLMNTPSDGGQRPIVSGVGIKTEAPVEEASYIKIKSSDKNMFSGFSYPIKVEVFDKNHNKLNIDPSEVILSSEFGNISENNITPNKDGYGQIFASYKNATGSVDIHFHSPIEEIELDVSSLQLKNGKVHIFETIYGKDKKGYRKKINSSQVNFSVSEGLGSLEGNKFTALQEGSATGTITANYNGVKRIIPVAVGSDSFQIFDFSNLEGANYFASTEDKQIISGNINLDPEGKDENSSLALNYNFASSNEQQVTGINFGQGLGFQNANSIGIWIKGDGQGTKIQAVLKDQNGNSKTIDLVKNVDFGDWKYVEASLPDELSGNISLEKIQVVLIEARAVSSTIKFDVLSAFVKKPLDWSLAQGSSQSFDPSIYQMTENNPAVFSITSLNKDGGDNSTSIAHLQNKNGAIIFNGASKETLAAINVDLKFNGNDSHNIKKINKTAFITLETNKYGIRSANSAQWKSFLKVLEDDGLKNIVIMMQRDPNKLPGEKEKDFFFNTIESGLKAGKNIFIIIPGNSTKVTMENGYRKVTMNSYDPAALDIFITDTNMSYILTRF